LGLIFLFMVMYAPGGIASLIMMNLRVAKYVKLAGLWVSYLGLGVTALVMLAGAGAMIEMVYHLQLNSALGDSVRFMGVPLNSRDVDSWVGASLVLMTGMGLFELARRHYAAQWSEIQASIEKDVQRGENVA
ncbi:MAG: branched-chain amino acid ABC transporter permease, partial [Limnohabitans sp.]